MPSDITAPSDAMAAERHAFEADGFFKLERGFDPADAARMEAEWWGELADKHGVVRADTATWRGLVTHMKRPKKARSERLFETERMRRAIDVVLGENDWDWPKHWGRGKLNMPSGAPAAAWDVPKRLWHWDGMLDWNVERPQSVFVFAFVGAVGPAGGGTLVLAGSQRLVRKQYWSLTERERAFGATWQRDQFGRLNPWLKALTGPGRGPEDRIGVFMREGTEVDGIPMRVVELTGAPGDAYFCDPLLVHCVAPNCGERPRMMRIQMVYNHETRRQILEETLRAQRREEGRQELRA